MWKSINASQQLMKITTCLCNFEHPVCYELWSNIFFLNYHNFYYYYFFIIKTNLKEMFFEGENVTM